MPSGGPRKAESRNPLHQRISELNNSRTYIRRTRSYMRPQAGPSEDLAKTTWAWNDLPLGVPDYDPSGYFSVLKFGRIDGRCERDCGNGSLRLVRRIGARFNLRKDLMDESKERRVHARTVNRVEEVRGISQRVLQLIDITDKDGMIFRLELFSGAFARKCGVF